MNTWTEERVTNAEANLMGILLSNPTAIEDVVPMLPVSKITNPVLKNLYEEMVKDFQSKGRISRVKGIEYIQGIDPELRQEILNSKFELYDIKDLVGKIKDGWTRSQLNKTVAEIAEATRNGKSAKEILSIAEEKVFTLSREEHGDKRPFLTLNDGPLMEAYNSYNDRLEGRLVDAGLRTGFRSIDRHLYGLQNGSLTVVGASTSTGKSNFVIQIASNVLKRNKKVLFFSLEMKKKQIIDRMVIMNSKVNARDFSTKPKKEDRERINRAFDKLHEYGENFFISDERGLGVMDIKSITRQIAHKQGVDLVIIDYLQNIKIPDSNKNYAKQVAETVKDLFDMALEINVPVILVSQLNRGHYQRKEKTPRLSDFRDSGEIEETADNVILLHNENADINKELWRQDPEDMSVIISKARGAETGAVNFTYHPKHLIFEDPLGSKLGEDGF